MWADVLALGILVAMLFFLALDDLTFWRTARRRATGTVTGHQRGIGDGSDSFFARVAFEDHLGHRHEIDDSVGRASPQPPIGTAREVEYPEVAPEKARVRHALMRRIIYVLVLCMLALMIAKILGWIG
jgi:hypothetical protein